MDHQLPTMRVVLKDDLRPKDLHDPVIATWLGQDTGEELVAEELLSLSVVSDPIDRQLRHQHRTQATVLSDAREDPRQQRPDRITGIAIQDRGQLKNAAIIDGLGGRAQIAFGIDTGPEKAVWNPVTSDVIRRGTTWDQSMLGNVPNCTGVAALLSERRYCPDAGSQYASE